ncbi:MAG: 50S ribosomal protein L17 [Candidatus Desulfofervidus auxilii]|nr:50S ribosomal protein L17 [Candidatus Desulfofervidus auxilii]
MRHRKKGRKLNRTWEHRKAMFKNMARSLVEYERIRTTLPKAKELRRLTDKLIRFGLENTVHARRKAFRILEDRTLVKKLFDQIAPRYKNRPGGFTRVVKLAFPRRGDCAEMAIVEFVQDELKVKEEKTQQDQKRGLENQEEERKEQNKREEQQEKQIDSNE